MFANLERIKKELHSILKNKDANHTMHLVYAQIYLESISARQQSIMTKLQSLETALSSFN